MINGETLKWMKAAPVPMLVVCLAAYVYAVDKKVDEQKATVAVAAEKATNANDTAKRIEEKVDKLLELVLKNEAEKAAAEKAKAEKKKP